MVGELAEKLLSLSPYDLFTLLSLSLSLGCAAFFSLFSRLDASTRSRIVHLEVKIEIDKTVSLNRIKTVGFQMLCVHSCTQFDNACSFEKKLVHFWRNEPREKSKN